jgi:rhamnogalacturonyl hydrolase YesR
MENYIQEKESAYETYGNDIEKIVRLTAGRYMGQNPPQPPVYRAYNKNGIRRLADYRYDFNFGEIFPLSPPLAPYETFVYAWAKLWSDQETDFNFNITAYGPVMVFVNEQPVFKSNILNERYPDYRSPVKVRLTRGWNSFVLRFIKTPAGFGGLLGPTSPKSLPLAFVIASAEREGQSGWLHTKPLTAELDKLPMIGDSEEGSGVGKLPTIGDSKEETGLEWLPAWKWHEKELSYGQFKRMYSLRKGCSALGWTTVYFKKADAGSYAIQGSNAGPIKVFLDGGELLSSDLSGCFHKRFTAAHGRHDILVTCLCGEKDWGFDLKITDKESGMEIPPLAPVRVHGSRSAWFYAGPLKDVKAFGPDSPPAIERLIPGVKGMTCWRLDEPGTWIRPFRENQLFGNWNYPLGVTLYGLIAAAEAFRNPDILDYVREHVESCTSTLDYALWDKDQYGAAGLDHHMTEMDCLDDCGSFASTMLELALHTTVRNSREVADYVADYIRNRQPRLPDGAFVRRNSYSLIAEDTLWADDLYMSVPFLCRYYRLTGDASVIDDAANQFLCYYKYLIRSDKGIFSHVFDFKIGKATEVSWGRGNGWAVFSLAELLDVLPSGHKDRPELLKMFRQLCAGYLALQDEEGMWHQVLTDWESYQETSCTSMFLYAFARGVRHGWLEDRDTYTEAAERAWKAISRISVDSHGNVYGVCRGSGFSFSSDYYKNDLSWNLNDTHGTGIVMLAGIEALKLENALRLGENALRPENAPQKGGERK